MAKWSKKLLGLAAIGSARSRSGLLFKEVKEK